MHGEKNDGGGGAEKAPPPPHGIRVKFQGWQVYKANFFFFYVALSRPTVKCEKTGSGFFFLLLLKMSDLGEEFAKICIQWPKKALVYAFWLHSTWVFPI